MLLFKRQVSLLLKQTVNTVTAANYAGGGVSAAVLAAVTTHITIVAFAAITTATASSTFFLSPLLAHSVKWPSYNKTKCVFLRNSFTMILSEDNEVI